MIRHFLNNESNDNQSGKENFSALMIECDILGEKVVIRSRLNKYLSIYKIDITRIAEGNTELIANILAGNFTQPLFDKFIKEQTFPIAQLIEDEKKVLESAISRSSGKGACHNAKKLNNTYDWYTTEIATLLDDRIKIGYKNELHNIFLKSLNQDENRILFKVSNYLIHFINWENRFNYFYESTYEVMPEEIKRIEQHFSDELRVSIKSYLAFNDQINVLQRFFEKRELGKISSLSYLDWETDVKKIIMDRFNNVFGEKKTLEYINHLENLLNESMKTIQ